MTLSVSAESLTDLFAAAAVELTDQLISADSVGEALREKLVLEGADLSRLLQEWLNMLIELLCVERMVFSRFQVLEIKGEGPVTLRAEVTGELIDPHRHQFLRKVVGLSCRSASIEGSGPFRAELQVG